MITLISVRIDSDIKHENASYRNVEFEYKNGKYHPLKTLVMPKNPQEVAKYLHGIQQLQRALKENMSPIVMFNGFEAIKIDVVLRDYIVYSYHVSINPDKFCFIEELWFTDATKGIASATNIFKQKAVVGHVAGEVVDGYVRESNQLELLLPKFDERVVLPIEYDHYKEKAKEVLDTILDFSVDSPYNKFRRTR